MWKYLKILLGFYMLVLTKCSLLEMSQTMWAKFLAGGLSKVGQLDPLRVPMVKVDQSEGNTSYRIILRNIEISGLNDSTIESIHVARGKLRSNLSELEAGYVTYSDLGDLESIRYKFHTVVNNMRKDNSDVDVARSEFNSSRYNDGRFERITQYQPRRSAYEKSGESNYGSYEQQRQTRFDERSYQEPREKMAEFITTDSSYMRNLKIEEKLDSHRTADNSNYPSSVHVIYAQSLKNTKADQEVSKNDKDEPDCPGNSDSKKSSFSMEDHGSFRTFDQDTKNVEQNHDDVHVSASENREIKLEQPTDRSSTSYFTEQRRNYKTTGNVDGKLLQSTERSSTLYFDDQRRDKSEENFRQQTERSTTSYFPNQRRNYQQGLNTNGKIEIMSPRSESIKSSNQRLENRPGYIDIIYADEKNSNGVKHFGNMRLQANREAKVYGFEDVMKDIQENARMFIHNFTEGESLTKTNDRIKKALEEKRLKDLARYAENYQEKEGYFEEGMELIYHYGGMGNESKEIRRIKRAHPENDSEDDVMHVIMRIRVPLLRVKSEYMLTGKVGEEILRGNGLLAGNFTELLGDFTVELKKDKNDSMTVRATRAKLTSKDKKIDLQGMNEEGPVKSILTQGLMAAEAVAAMLADDLTTKALSEKTADAMIDFFFFFFCLAPGVTACPRTSDLPTYDKCVLKQLETITPYLAKGIPSLKLPPLDPLLLPSLTVDRNLEALKIKANMSQIRVYGATNFLVEELNANPHDLTVSIKVQLPHVHVKGDYDVHGRLLLLPLNGAGSFKGNFTNTEAKVNAQGKEITDKDGIQRLEIDKLDTKIRVGSGNIKLKAPPSHTVAADAAATFFNSNPRLVLDIASPIIEDTAATISRALAARALGVLTKAELVP
ncbi:Circadian clock-controlled protein [Vespula squamosa]|uniref:Circadian clock-controlled protein n=1 Tax=Vespula squamosa TaxID=30214 RepID=A0ABD2BA48_VESSQ